MNMVRASLCIVIVFCGRCSPGQTLPSSSHGTVNILLANKNGLVAVTDSMLTFSNGSHQPIGRKLFKIDDRTICTIAGSYTAYVPPPDLGLDVRKVVDSFSIRLRTNPLPKLSSKLELLARLLKIALQSDNLTSQIAFGRANTREPIQLTMMASFELDKLICSLILPALKRTCRCSCPLRLLLQLTVRPYAK